MTHTKINFNSFPVIFSGTGAIPPATAVNYVPWTIVGFIFQFVIRRRHFSWWAKYNCALSALHTSYDFELTLPSLISPLFGGNNLHRRFICCSRLRCRYFNYPYFLLVRLRRVTLQRNTDTLFTNSFVIILVVSNFRRTARLVLTLFSPGGATQCSPIRATGIVLHSRPCLMVRRSGESFPVLSKIKRGFG